MDGPRGVWGVHSMFPAKGMVGNAEFCDACTTLPLSVAGNVTVNFVSMSCSAVRYHGAGTTAGGGRLRQQVQCSSASAAACDSLAECTLRLSHVSDTIQITVGSGHA
eukprot:363913-Chlamydomonas_euryale.AAC.9